MVELLTSASLGVGAVLGLFFLISALGFLTLITMGILGFSIYGFILVSIKVLFTIKAELEGLQEDTK